MEIYTNPCVTIDYDSEYDCLKMTWKKFTRSEILRDAYKTASSTLRTNRPKHWLLDKTHIKVISPEDQLWLANEWAMDLKGEYKLAFIDSVDVFGQLSIRNVINRIQKDNLPLKMKVFKEKQEAVVWFQEQ